ncbi:MAG: curli biogenesis system outer membrane secretion channel CsgG [Colwellia sp.]|jgi:curli biogenesis system outer membrane secretion channel CsgG|uniref:CsgG/HfaB family protein n=1 Tax=unclassified Colwellia TaxID=196834 RepID=UPI0015F7407D|nr:MULTISPECIES: CsgG/HfaB family protein [unclassified Colwellia]MBA6254102.1 CsgG/HfaB family protein [Colwellia sp. MB3u-55]MBA6350623.1 CsgG/HfaB family protein [Colwellia sp. BRX9-1]MBA6377591.1 CsgG/HfaB family protein [Colwellia sp. BRX10-7]MBA6382420.1 CsgG/HfaB family protein [Colwellia sp. BRX10-9]MBA6386463.1 CsgG/HfaB family protein [Colwellia sp. BRX10-2]
MKKLLIVSSLLLASGCATVKDSTVTETKQKKAAVSQTLQADVVSKKYLKRKVAIGRFTNETKYGQSFFIDKNNDRIGKQAMDILSAKLFETDRFIMLERADLAQVEKELSIGGETSLKNAADFLIVGSISEFGRKNTSEVGIFSRVKKQEANATVNIRLIDVSTGQIIYSESGKGIAFSEAGSVMGVGDKAGYDSSLNDKVLNAAITDLASNVIENMLDKPWKSYILSSDEGNLIISGGKSQNISENSKFTVYKSGNKVKNPQTGMFITLPGKPIGNIVVLTSMGDTPESEISIASISTGDFSQYIASGDFSSLYIQESK